MPPSEEINKTTWVKEHAERYVQVQPMYESYAKVLAQVLRHAAKKLAPMAIVQARAKSLASFAEKIIRKRRIYTDPLLDITDLCGGRVIVHTAEQVHAVCQFIEQHFDIDWNNSDDVTQRLRPTEFGYRSVHYIVMFKQDAFPSKDVPVDIPQELWQPLGPGLMPPRAEVQVRTILEHAWADISHDLTYKSAFKVPSKFHRDFATIAAVLEGADREFGRIHDGFRTYASNYAVYLKEEKAVREEIETLELVLEYDDKNAELATKIANLASTIGDWQKAVDTLRPYEQWEYQPACRTLGNALCKLHRDCPTDPDFQKGRKTLKKAAAAGPTDAEARRALAESWEKEDEDEARRYYREAFEIDPTNPACLASYLEYEIAWQKKDDIISLLTPTIAAASQRCRNQIMAEVDVPQNFLHLGMFHLLRGQSWESLAAYSKAIECCNAAFMLENALTTLKRLRFIANVLPAHEWVRRLVLLGLAAKCRDQAARAKTAKLASPECPPIQAPAVIVAGGCDASVQEQMQNYRELLVGAFKDFTGTVISGGTTQGIAGVVGDVRQHYGPQLRAIGYIPRSLPSDATKDTDQNRYDEIRETEGREFSALEPLQNWIDLLASGIDPSEVVLLGINGGTIAAAEYRMAAALGARVLLLEDSGREASKVFNDPDWEDCHRLLRTPVDVMTIRSFVSPSAQEFDQQTCEALAKEIHEDHRGEVARGKAGDKSAADWKHLPEDLQDSNYAQANHIYIKARQIGCELVPLDDPRPPYEFTPDEIEWLSEMEHGRWNAERLAKGWRYGETKDIDRKINPSLVTWQDLPDSIKEYDRAAVRRIPQLLAQIGLKICRQR